MGSRKPSKDEAPKEGAAPSPTMRMLKEMQDKTQKKIHDSPRHPFRKLIDTFEGKR